MATHSSVLAWGIPGTGEPGGLPSMRSQSRTRLKQLSSSSNIKKGKQLYNFIKYLMMTSGEGNGTHSSTLAWTNPWTEEPGRLQSMGSLGVGHTERLHFHFSLSRIGEGNGNPLQCSFLKNPRDGGAWWAAVYGVAQSRTRLKQLGSSSIHR